MTVKRLAKEKAQAEEDRKNTPLLKRLFGRSNPAEAVAKKKHAKAAPAKKHKHHKKSKAMKKHKSMKKKRC